MMDKINLSGTWQYKLDKNDIGIKESWFEEKFSENTITLPGSTNSNKIGDKLDENCSDTFSKESIAGIKENYTYEGVLWLQKEVSLEKNLLNSSWNLILERTLGLSQVWINGKYLGENYSLSTPHIYPVKFEIKKLLLTIRLDNRDLMHIGTRSSAYSLDTQGFWNGIIGELSLVKSNPLEMEVAFKNELLKISFPKMLDFQIVIKDFNGKEVPFEIKEEIVCTNKCSLTLKLQEVLTWSEFQPHFYDVEVIGEKNFQKRVGYVSLKSDERKVFNHKKRIFLRGNLDCGIFPETGYFPTDEFSWKEIFQKEKDYGFNHVRFHSWCPPEAAFKVADSLGIYLMVEGPFWLDSWFHNSVGDYKEHYSFIKKECLNIVKSYGHHPSFCFFAVGNELAGDFKFLAEILADDIFTKYNILTTITANTTNLKRDFYENADDFFVGVEYLGKGLRGNRFLDDIVSRTDFNYDESAKILPKPVITHEIGQYASFPSLKEIKKFDGNMSPVNLLAIKNELIRKGLLEKSQSYTYYSGMLAIECYKGEIEAAVRSNNLSGFQLLGLQDYLGQNTAAVGILDSHWEEKGFCSKEFFSQFNQEIIPMIELNKKIFQADERLNFKIGVRNSLEKTITKEDQSYFSLKIDNEIILEKILKKNISSGDYEIIYKGSFSLENLKIKKSKPIILKLTVTLSGKEYVNDWVIWLFKIESQDTQNEIVEDDFLSPKILSALNDGKNCIVSLSPQKHQNVFPGNYFPVFWSPAFFKSEDICGMIINEQHPLFKYFPTFKHVSVQWKRLLENSISFDDHAKWPIIELIPNFFSIENRTNIEEFQVGKGRLLLHGFNLTNPESPEEMAFKNALFSYVSSKEFQPKEKVSITQLETFYPTFENLLAEKENLAVGCKTWADNEKSYLRDAKKAIDGNPLTFWTTASQTENHFWAIDFGKKVAIGEIVIAPLNFSKVDFEIYLSNDNVKWQKVIKNTQRTEQQYFKGSYQMRFLKIVFQHPINISPGLIHFKAFA